jgi:hypothetical protein
MSQGDLSSEDEEFQIWDEPDELDSEKQERIEETLKQYAARFQVKLGLKKIVTKDNPLVPPRMRDEGKRDKKTMKLEKYFGDKSRQDFFGRSNWVRDKRNVMNKGDNIADKVVMTPKLDYSVDFAFAPRRFDNLDDDEEDDDNDDDDEEDEEDGHSEEGQGLDAQTTYTHAPTNMAASVCSLSTIVSESTLHTTCSAIERGTPTSPRTRYIGNCINSHINPRASLILRKRVSTELNLKHQVNKNVYVYEWLNGWL